MKLDINFFIYFCKKDDNTYKLYLIAKSVLFFMFNLFDNN